MCIGDTNCAAMGYTEGTQTCRLGSDIMDSATLDTDCVAAETVYESSMYHLICFTIYLLSA